MTDTPYHLSDLLVEYLHQLGVEYVFGVPGVHVSALFEALARSEKKGGPRAILARHETGAAHMADGYARETGKLGVCCATTGPGASNLVTGVASAYLDHTPLFVITGQTPVPQFGMAAFQESSPDMMDTSAMLALCTYYSSVITHAQQFENKLCKALSMALRSPRGPVHLSIPVDLSRTPVPQGISYPDLPALLMKRASFVDDTALETLCHLVDDTLSRERRITLLVGHECADATEAVMAFAESVNAQVITTQRGKAWADPYHPLVRGVFGYAGHQTARQALNDDAVDLVLAAGTGLGQWSTSGFDKVLLNNKLVHIHPLSDYFSRSPMAKLHVCGRVKTVFDALVSHLKTKHDEKIPAPFLVMTSTEEAGDIVPPQINVISTDQYYSENKPIHPQRLVSALMQQHFPAETRFVVDTSNWLPWTLHYFFTPHHGNYRISSELAAMGWGLGAAVGTALGTPKTPVVCLVGDGSFLMNGQEITVAVQEHLTVIYLILNDSGYGMVKHRHRQVTEEALEFSFPRADFSLMAKAVGAQGYRIQTIEELEQLDYTAICKHPGPTVLDLLIDPEAVPPMGMF